MYICMNACHAYMCCGNNPVVHVGRVSIYISVYIYIYAYIQSYAHNYTDMHVCVHACMHACACWESGGDRVRKAPICLSESPRRLAGVLEVEVVLGAQGAAEGPAHGRSQRLSGQGGRKAAERRGAGLPTGHAAQDFLLSPEAPAWEKLESLHPPGALFFVPKRGGRLAVVELSPFCACCYCLLGTGTRSRWRRIWTTRHRPAPGAALRAETHAWGTRSFCFRRSSPSLWTTWTLSAAAARTRVCSCFWSCFFSVSSWRPGQTLSRGPESSPTAYGGTRSRWRLHKHMSSHERLLRHAVACMMSVRA